MDMVSNIIPIVTLPPLNIRQRAEPLETCFLDLPLDEDLGEVHSQPPSLSGESAMDLLWFTYRPNIRVDDNVNDKNAQVKTKECKESLGSSHRIQNAVVG